jgi:hypothetical protein
MWLRHDPNGPAPTFAQQRLILMALLVGMAIYTIAIAVVLLTNDGKGLSPEFFADRDWIVPVLAASMATGAMVLRGSLQRGADALTGDARSAARFRATLIPVALLEGGCLIGLSAWLITGRSVPHLVTALVLLAIAIAIVPFSDSDRQ